MRVPWRDLPHAALGLEGRVRGYGWCWVWGLASFPPRSGGMTPLRGVTLNPKPYKLPSKTHKNFFLICYVDYVYVEYANRMN